MDVKNMVKDKIEKPEEEKSDKVKPEEVKPEEKLEGWMKDIEKESLDKATEFEILPQLKLRLNTVYSIKVLDDIPREITPQTIKFSDTMFVLKVLYNEVKMSLNVTSKSARFSLAKLMKQYKLKSLRNLELVAQKVEGLTKSGINAEFINFQKKD